MGMSGANDRHARESITPPRGFPDDRHRRAGLRLLGVLTIAKHRIISTAALVALAAALTLALAGCASGGEDNANPGQGAATTTAAGGDGGYGGSGETTTTGEAAGGGSGEATLTAEGFQWSETSLSLPAGTTTLTVANADSAKHSFTAQQINVDEDVEGGASTDVELDLSGASGSIDFVCKYHPAMTGTIEVTS